MTNRTGKLAYVIDSDTDTPIITRGSVKAARQAAAEYNESVGRSRYRAESCESFRNNTAPRRPTLKAAIEWIAANDEPEETDVEAIACQVSTALVADLFGKTPGSIAVRIIATRNKK
jgi:hypothetical protein